MRKYKIHGDNALSLGDSFWSVRQTDVYSRPNSVIKPEAGYHIGANLRQSLVSSYDGWDFLGPSQKIDSIPCVPSSALCSFQAMFKSPEL